MPGKSGTENYLVTVFSQPAGRLKLCWRDIAPLISQMAFSAQDMWKHGDEELKKM